MTSAPRSTGGSGGAAQAIKRAVVGLVGRERANRLSAPYHDWQARRAARAYLRALPASGLCVQIGCGENALPGWVNLDGARGPRVDLVWDLRNGMPFPDRSCAAVFGEHIIEHLSKEDAEALLRECHRVLEPGGVLRLSTPDMELYLRSYAGDGEFLRHPSFTEPVDAPVDRVNIVMRSYGHLWVYDAPLLGVLLRRAGFSSAVRQEFGASLHPRMRGVDAPSRAFESLYMEAVK